MKESDHFAKIFIIPSRAVYMKMKLTFVGQGMFTDVSESIQ